MSIPSCDGCHQHAAGRGFSHIAPLISAYNEMHSAALAACKSPGHLEVFDVVHTVVCTTCVAKTQP